MAGKGISGLKGDVFSALEDGAGNLDVAMQVAEVKKWSCTMKANVAKYCSNKTGGYKKAVTGAHDGNGSLDCVWDPTLPATEIFEEGSYVSLQLFTVNAPAPGQVLLMRAAIANLKVDVDMDNGDPITWTCDFESNEQWTNAAAIAPLLGPLGAPQEPLTPSQEEFLERARAVGLEGRAYRMPQTGEPLDVEALQTAAAPVETEEPQRRTVRLSAEEFRRFGEEDVRRVVREVRRRLAS